MKYVVSKPRLEKDAFCVTGPAFERAFAVMLMPVGIRPLFVSDTNCKTSSA